MFEKMSVGEVLVVNTNVGAVAVVLGGFFWMCHCGYAVPEHQHDEERRGVRGSRAAALAELVRSGFLAQVMEQPWYVAGEKRNAEKVRQTRKEQIESQHFTQEDLGEMEAAFKARQVRRQEMKNDNSLRGFEESGS